jgi:hypothetical protein
MKGGTMKRLMAIGVLCVLALFPLATGAGSAEAPRVVEFDTMAAVQGPYVGTANPIRGVNGGGLPWQIERGVGELRTDGRLDIQVEGLVLFDGAPVPPSLRGTNPVSEFRAVVSCESIVEGAARTVNRTTRRFPATRDGDATIRAVVAIPRPCFAPVVFVTSPGGAWFAVTGV